MTEPKPTDPRALALLPAGFHTLDGARKVNAILDLPDPRGFVQALSPDELYLLVRDIGLEDATDLVAMSSVEQRLTFVDIDAWRGDALEAVELEGWIDTLRDISVELAVETVQSLDPELIVDYLLGHVVAIFDRTQEDDIAAHDAFYQPVQTPDGDYVLVMPQDDAEAIGSVRRMIDLLYRGGLENARAIITLAMTGLRLENEELAGRFRAGRLADLGFPEPETAHELFAPIRVEAIRQELEEQPGPSGDLELQTVGWALAHAEVPRSFLARCAASVEDRERFARDFAMCVNRAVMAMPGPSVLRDTERVVELSRRVHQTASLGLEILAEGDTDRGAQMLEKAWMLQLFQVGHGAAVERARRGRRLSARGAGLFDERTQAVLDGLARLPQPLMADVSGMRAFATRADLAAIDAVLGAAEAVVDGFERVFGFDRQRLDAHDFEGLREDDRPFISFDTLARTLIAHVAAGEAPSFEPLTLDQLKAARAQADALASHAAALADRLDAAARPILTRAAAELQDALTSVASGEALDPRYLLGTVLVRA